MKASDFRREREVALRHACEAENETERFVFLQRALSAQAELVFALREEQKGFYTGTVV